MAGPEPQAPPHVLEYLRKEATLTVATTDARDVAAIEAEGARALVVRHSLGQLDAAKAKLDRAAKSTRTADAPVWFVDVKSNAVVVKAVKGSGGQRVSGAGSTQSPVGGSICRSGSTTGWHCGTISQHNTSVTYPEGTISGVTRTTVCAEPGDSGGSYISGSQAQGVTSGGSGNCRSGGTTFHQPINPLLQQYQLTLKTTGGGQDPDPGDPTGTWAAGSVYAAGDTVTYNGATYRCLQPHQAQPGWEPPNTPALWEAA